MQIFLLRILPSGQFGRRLVARERAVEKMMMAAHLTTMRRDLTAA
jgi:hypothetical protein